MRSLVVAVALVVGTFGGMTPANADPRLQPLLSTGLGAAAFRSGGYEVFVGASSERTESGTGTICLSATKVVRTRTTMKTTSQAGCLDGISYRFDPIAWTADASGAGGLVLWEEVSELRGGEWVRRSSRVVSRRAPVRLRLAWEGRGEVAPHVRAPGCGYSLPPSCSAGVAFLRDAGVGGRIRFDALGLGADVPTAHDGWMTWS